MGIFSIFGNEKKLAAKNSANSSAEKLIENTIEMYKLFDANSNGTDEPHIILMHVLSQALGDTYRSKMSTEEYEAFGINFTQKCACINPYDNARALALWYIIDNWGEMVDDKYGQEFERLMTPVLTADRNGKLQVLYAKYNPKMAKLVVEPVNENRHNNVETPSVILKEMLRKGVGLIESGDLREGISILDELLKQDSTCVDAYYHRGYAYGALGNHEQAIKDFDKTIALYPRKSQAHFQRGNAYLRSGNFQQAIDNYNIAIELEPYQAMNYSNRGNAYSGLANNHQAIRDFSTAIELDPYYSSAYYNRGHMYSNLGNHDLALIDYKKAIELNPQDADPYRNLAGTYFHLNNLSMAIPNFIMAAKLGDKTAQEWLISNRSNIAPTNNGKVNDVSEPAPYIAHVIEPRGADFTAVVNRETRAVLSKTISYVNALERVLYEDQYTHEYMAKILPMQYSQLVIECIILNAHLVDRKYYSLYGPAFRSKAMLSILPSIAEFIENDTLRKSLPNFKGMCTLVEKVAVSSYYQEQMKDVDLSLNISLCTFETDELDARFSEYSVFVLSNKPQETGKRALLERFSENISKCICDQSDTFTTKCVQVHAIKLGLASLLA